MKNIQNILAWLKEWKVGVFLFVNALIFFALFYNDINSRSEIGNREIIGDIIFKYNQVQRKFDRQLIWDDLDTNGPLSNRDTIRSDKGSQAVLQLKDGTEIQMDEESMVIVEISENLQKINFEKGSINIKKKPVKGSPHHSIMVDSPSGSVQVKDGDVIVAKENLDQFNVAVSRGEATVNIDGKTISLKENQILSSKDGELVAKESKVVMEDPEARARKIEKRKRQTYQAELERIQSNASTVSKLKVNEVVDAQSQPEKKNENNIENSKFSPAITPAPVQNKPASPPSNNINSTTKPKSQKEDPTEEIRRKREQAEFERFMKM
ncbi:FecR family protein [Leptospira sp. GIMC2001]|uniref:FecR family protein n=1 Tax=Leptospira sp. GIMC2001 TaxID=1513297 RepID=UPI00234AF94E|nr:FecR family protein [Leptospira sp. GIMC2001]WCL49712.1 FecR family protein [Leptospira sp. GIMC2001]